jgi:uncharacterized damage-inducible protein DinB
MTMDRSYVATNDAERRRLEALVRKLDDAALARPMDAGWTVASVLGHLAFWDQRTVVLADLLRRGAAVPVEQAHDVDWINDATKPLLLAVPVRRLAELSLAIATAADRAVETLTDAELERNTAVGTPINLRRAEHRRQHLDDVDRVLAR